MDSQAVEELMQEFGLSQEDAETMAATEELGVVFDETGTIIDVDPDEPIDLVPSTEQTAAGWN